jgi:hypothetical protein
MLQCMAPKLGHACCQDLQESLWARPLLHDWQLLHPLQRHKYLRKVQGT